MRDIGPAGRWLVRSGWKRAAVPSVVSKPQIVSRVLRDIVAIWFRMHRFYVTVAE